MTDKKTTSAVPTLLLGLLLPSAIIGAGVGAFFAMGKSEPKQAATETGPLAKLRKLPIVSVDPGKAWESGQIIDLELSGVVVPYRQVTIAAEVAGKLVYKNVDCRTGHFVEAGEVLFKLDATDYQMEVDRLSALRESEYAQQKELDQEIENARRLQGLADEEISIQEREIKRLQQLPSGFASETELDQVRRGLISASNQKLAIQNQLELLATKRTRILLAEKLAATQLSMARVNLDRTEIKAPIAGVIVMEMAEESSFIQKGDNLCMIDDTSRVEVSCNLRADQLMLVLDQRPAKPTANDGSVESKSYELPPTPATVQYRIAGRDDDVYEWQGHISRYEGIGLDAKSRTIPIRIVVERPREVTFRGEAVDAKTRSGIPALVKGMFVSCKIHTQPKSRLMLIPKLALRPSNDVWFVEPIAEETSNPESLTDSEREEAAKWKQARVRSIDGIRPLRTLRLGGNDAKEYWIIQAREDLPAESLFIVSPTTGLRGDGSDQVKYSNL